MSFCARTRWIPRPRDRTPRCPHVGLVVEGKGDINAMPLLLRRYMESTGDYRDLIGKPIPLHGRGNATGKDGIERYAATSEIRPGCVGVLVVLDADDDCAAQFGPSLRARAEGAVASPVRVVLAERNFEDWLYASIETLSIGQSRSYSPGASGLGAIVELLRSRKYAKATWQARLTSQMDIGLAAGRSRSLARLLTHFDTLRGLV